jgi:hypothetical protein
LEVVGRGSSTQPFNKNVRGGLVALAESKVQNQFAVAFDCNECVGIAEVLIIIGADALLLLADERL